MYTSKGPALDTRIPLTIDRLHDAYRRGGLRPSHVVEAWLERPERERAPPVWISTHAATLLRERARVLDEKLARHPEDALASPVFGALAGVKDNIDCAGLPTTAGCPAFSYRPIGSAAAVARLESAGALVVGKTNLDQFATGLVGTRSPYGAVPNTFRAEMISGGSSSGSAAAVALGQVHFALGTDTAGSGRVPAGLNNIVGWKPTRGMVSTAGVVPACRSIDCVSILALTVADAGRAFEVLRDPMARALDQPMLGGAFTFAIPLAAQLEFYGDAHAEAAFAGAVQRLEDLGGVALPIDFSPYREVAEALYGGPHVAERHAAIRDFLDAHPDAIEPTVRAIIESGRGYSASDLFVAQARIEEMRATLATAWRSADVLVVPTVPTVCSIAEVMADPIERNRRMGTYTNFVNLLDLAAIAVPASMRADGMPAGITLVGPAGSDLMLAELAQRVHVDTGLTLGATGFAHPAEPALSLAAADVLEIAVVGAHLQGLPLNRELTTRGARLARVARTAPFYRLFALPGTTPPKPGLVRVAHGGERIAVEVWSLPARALGAFVAGVPSPLCIGTLELDDGTRVHGFLCEHVATAAAEDISRYGGWRSYLEQALPKAAPAIPHKE